MIFKQLIELYDLLDSPAASGAGVVEYLRGIDPACDAETYVLEGPKGSTDMVRVRIPGSRGRAGGAAGAHRLRVGWRRRADRAGLRSEAAVNARTRRRAAGRRVRLHARVPARTYVPARAGGVHGIARGDRSR